MQKRNGSNVSVSNHDSTVSATWADETALLLVWKNADDFSRFAEFLEVHDTGDLRKKCIVTADTHIDAGLKTRAPLTDNDASRRHYFSAEPFHPETLCIAVATVA